MASINKAEEVLLRDDIWYKVSDHSFVINSFDDSGKIGFTFYAVEGAKRIVTSGPIESVVAVQWAEDIDG